MYRTIRAVKHTAPNGQTITIEKRRREKYTEKKTVIYFRWEAVGVAIKGTETLKAMKHEINKRFK